MKHAFLGSSLRQNRLWLLVELDILTSSRFTTWSGNEPRVHGGSIWDHLNLIQSQLLLHLWPVAVLEVLWEPVKKKISCDLQWGFHGEPFWEDLGERFWVRVLCEVCVMFHNNLNSGFEDLSCPVFFKYYFTFCTWLLWGTRHGPLWTSLRTLFVLLIDLKVKIYILNRGVIQI